MTFLKRIKNNLFKVRSQFSIRENAVKHKSFVAVLLLEKVPQKNK